MLALRRAAVAATQKRAAFSAPAQVANFSDKFKDKERAAETVYFNKEDERSLRKLLKKLKGQADQTDAAGLKDHVEHDTKGLEKLGLNLSKDQVEALLKWKHEH